MGDSVSQLGLRQINFLLKEPITGITRKKIVRNLHDYGIVKLITTDNGQHLYEMTDHGMQLREKLFRLSGTNKKEGLKL